MNDNYKPLMTEGVFQLRSWHSHGLWKSIITHDCTVRGDNWIAPVNGTVLTCYSCDDRVPENLEAAWILHNFDAIQQYKKEI